MPTDRSIAKTNASAAKGVLGMTDPGGTTAKENQRFTAFRVAADALAATTTQARMMVLPDRPGHIVSCRVWMEGYTVPQGATNFVTFNLFADNDAGGGSYQLSSTGLSTNVVTLMKNQSQAMSFPSGGATFVAGAALYIDVAKGSSGQTLPLWGAELCWEED